MSILRPRRRRTAAPRLVTAGIFVVIQVWSLAVAGPAYAVTGCVYDRSSRIITISIGPGEWASLAVETAADDLDPESPPDAILFNANGAGFDAGGLSTQCGVATTSNTDGIVVTGQPSADETFFIDEYETSGRFPSVISWNIDLGSNTVGVGGFDLFGWTGNNGPGGPGVSAPYDDTVVLTDSSFNLDGATGQIAGIELISLVGGAGDDTLDGSALVTVRMLAVGSDGDDWIAPGRFGTNTSSSDDPKGDVVRGNAGVDTLSYGTRTDATVINNKLELAGHDGNGDCDLNDVGDERDILMDPFEVLETGSGPDCLIGDAGIGEVASELFIARGSSDRIWGGAGNDILRAGAGNDVLRAGAGNDVLRGGAGNDRMLGGPGFDVGNGGSGTNICKSVEVRKNCKKV